MTEDKDIYSEGRAMRLHSKEELDRLEREIEIKSGDRGIFPPSLNGIVEQSDAEDEELNKPLE